MQELEETQATKKIALVIYILYICLLVFPILPIIGIIVAYIFEDDAKSYLVSHFQFLIRSFWIAVLYFTVSSLLIVVFIGVLLVPICAIWWIIRMVKGLKALIHDQPIANPKTWVF